MTVEREPTRWRGESISYWRARYTSMLKAYVPPHMRNLESMQVLSVGCKYGLEAGGLLGAFPDVRVTYLGVDINEAYIVDAKSIVNPDLPPNVEFMVRDARETLGDGQWDLVYVGHPVVGSAQFMDDDGLEIMQRSIEAVKPSGVIAITTYILPEREAVEAILRQYPDIDILLSGSNASAGELPWSHEFITVGVKQRQ